MENGVNLVGMFFLTKAAGAAQYQGQVVAEVSSGYFLCQLFDWFVGAPSYLILRSVVEMTEWQFYAEADDWRHAAGTAL